MNKFGWSLVMGGVLALGTLGRATETENQLIRILPGPGKITVDGQIDDWDLSGGIFACGDVEQLRDQYAVWFHAMYDADNLYLLARWNDPTPLNNPENLGGHGFNADCLQLRVILFPDAPERTVTWWTMWRDAKGLSISDRSWPGPRNGVKDNPLPNLVRAEEQGVSQSFQAYPDGRGYVQEVAIPWKLLSISGKAPGVGEKFRLAIEPNFTAGSFGRITIKDLFEASNKPPDRIFTFRAFSQWGWATLEAKGKVDPMPVRLADRRTFPMSMKEGVPVIDWTGVITKFEWPGFKPITFEMPFDGYVSLNLVGPDGLVARHLLNWDKRAPGPCTVKWDGLSDATYRTPGLPVPAGEYTWKAIAHPRSKLTFRGYASYGGKMPWSSTPKNEWLGDHGVPTAVVTDGERMYLACNGAEGGRHLLATDFQGSLIWSLQNTTGASDPEHIAVADGAVYILHPKSSWAEGGAVITRADAKTGAYLSWPGTKSHILKITDIWREGTAGADHFEGLDVQDGKLYATVSDPLFCTADVTNWMALITQFKADTPLSKRIMAGIDTNTYKNVNAFLSGKMTEERAFSPAKGKVKLDARFIQVLNALLATTNMAPDTASLAYPARAFANRRFMEQAFAPNLRPQPSPCVVVMDITTGKVIRTWPVPAGTTIKVVNSRLVYVLSGGTDIVALDPETGKSRTLITGLKNARGITVDTAGKIYVSVWEPEMQVLVFSSAGVETGRIGRKGGRAPLGLWQADGLMYPAGIAVDREGKLWVMERDRHPKRVSVWNLADSKLISDFFGPTQYGASGSAINPRDPDLMVGVGCEWRLDPKTGKSACVGVFDRQYHGYATFREGKNGRQYLYTDTGHYGTDSLQVWERLGDANYVLRAELRAEGEWRSGGGKAVLWVDENGDGKEQPEEIQSQDGALVCQSNNGWTFNLGPDLTIYPKDYGDGKLKALSADGFTACGAPRYKLAQIRMMPDVMNTGYSGVAMPSADNKMILINVQVKDHPAGHLWSGFELATGKLLWTYPNPYYQVHGSHNAPAPEAGLFRGAFGPVGSVELGGGRTAWVINGNLGEWNVLTSDGFFLERLFTGNIFEYRWPADTTPGSDMTDVPPGCGGEDFGGSVSQSKDGAMYVQSGKNAIWNLALTGLDKITEIPGGKVTLSEVETKQALALREAVLQAAKSGAKSTVKRAAVVFTGNVAQDFKGCSLLEFQKMENAKVRASLAHDGTTLYLGWEVRDSTPWTNGATDISQMYACGDTVDFQIGSDSAADAKRQKAVKGDLRLSIGNYQGKPTAVLYKFVSADKKPRTFSSGVIQGYQVDWVDVLADAIVKVKPGKEGYTVEAAVPLASLGLTLTPKMTLRGDLGVTHADPSGARTKLRTYWANQKTGLVDDVVFELQLTPQNWGELVFE